MDEPRTTWKERLTHQTTILAVAGGLVLGAAGTAAWWRVSFAPSRALTEKRVQATLDIARLYALELSYKQAHGAYANDLNALLSAGRDGAALKASLAANVDMNTLAVVGDAQKFKIELNVLDAGRTLIKVKGPVVPRAQSAAAPSVMPAPAPPQNADGAPINSGR
ncbi:MAG: hypothetical protein ACHQ49_11075 [Elusimicrobiota bacterium]